MSLNKRLFIQGADDAIVPSEHFDIQLWTGNSTARSITGVGFQPDFVYIMPRVTEHKSLFDSERGATKSLLTTLTNTEYTGSDSLTSFDSDGFSLGTDAAQRVNHSGHTYVGYCLKGGGNSNTYNVDGTGYSTKAAAGLADDGDLSLNGASVNTVAGFGIYKINPSVTVGETNSFEHGLNAAPELVITKNTSLTTAWWTFTDALDDSWDYLRLNTTDAKTDDTYTSGEVADATNIRVNRTFFSTSSDAIIYAFHSVEGFSKIGTYTGASNKEVTGLGFQPSFLMIKRTDTSGNSWLIVDKERTESNGNLSELFADSSSGEGGTGYDIDLDADGFTLNTSTTNANATGGTYIYLAIA